MSSLPLEPLPALLGIRPGSTVSLINPPSGFAQRLNPLPEGVEFLVTARAGLDVILFFPADKLELVERLPPLARSMAVTGAIWICYAKGKEALSKSALSEDFVRLAGLEFGLVDNKRCEFDERWTGLRLVWGARGKRAEKPGGRHTTAEA